MVIIITKYNQQTRLPILVHVGGTPKPGHEVMERVPRSAEGGGAGGAQR